MTEAFPALPVHSEIPRNGSRYAELVSGSIFLRPNYLAKAGQIHAGHKHEFDHTTVLLSGSARVTRKKPDGESDEIILRSPRDSDWDHWMILIEADCTHEFTALEDNTMFACVYSHRTPQGHVSVPYTGWAKAYSDRV